MLTVLIRTVIVILLSATSVNGQIREFIEHWEGAIADGIVESPLQELLDSSILSQLGFSSSGESRLQDYYRQREYEEDKIRGKPMERLYEEKMREINNTKSESNKTSSSYSNDSHTTLNTDRPKTSYSRTSADQLEAQYSDLKNTLSSDDEPDKNEDEHKQPDLWGFTSGIYNLLAKRHSGAAHAKIFNKAASTESDQNKTSSAHPALQQEAAKSIDDGQAGSGVTPDTDQQGKWLADRQLYIGGSKEVYTAGEDSASSAKLKPVQRQVGLVCRVMDGYWGTYDSSEFNVFEYAYNFSPDRWNNYEVSCFCVRDSSCSCDRAETIEYFADLKNSQTPKAQFKTYGKHTHVAVNGTMDLESRLGNGTTVRLGSQPYQNQKHDRERANSDSKSNGSPEIDMKFVVFSAVVCASLAVLYN